MRVLEQGRRALGLGARVQLPRAAPLAVRNQIWAALSSQLGGGKGRGRWVHVECLWGCQAPLIRVHLFPSITAGWFIPQSLCEAVAYRR